MAHCLYCMLIMSVVMTCTVQEPKSDNQTPSQRHKDKLKPLLEATLKLMLENLSAADVNESTSTDRHQNHPNHGVLISQTETDCHSNRCRQTEGND